MINGNRRQRHHGKAVKRRSYSARLFVRRRKCRDEVNFFDLESFRDRLSCSEMSVMDRIECPTQYRDPHVSRSHSSELGIRKQWPGSAALKTGVSGHSA